MEYGKCEKYGKRFSFFTKKTGYLLMPVRKSYLNEEVEDLILEYIKFVSKNKLDEKYLKDKLKEFKLVDGSEEED